MDVAAMVETVEGEKREEEETRGPRERGRRRDAWTGGKEAWKSSTLCGGGLGGRHSGLVGSRQGLDAAVVGLYGVWGLAVEDDFGLLEIAAGVWEVGGGSAAAQKGRGNDLTGRVKGAGLPSSMRTRLR